jgi:hypothetical protein
MLRATTASAFRGIEIVLEKNQIKIIEMLNTAAVRYILRRVVAFIPSNTLSYSMLVITTAPAVFNLVNAANLRLTLPVSDGSLFKESAVCKSLKSDSTSCCLFLCGLSRMERIKSSPERFTADRTREKSA